MFSTATASYCFGPNLIEVSTGLLLSEMVSNDFAHNQNFQLLFNDSRLEKIASIYYLSASMPG